jgi:hypothetical protein
MGLELLISILIIAGFGYAYFNEQTKRDNLKKIEWNVQLLSGLEPLQSSLQHKSLPNSEFNLKLWHYNWYFQTSNDKNKFINEIKNSIDQVLSNVNTKIKANERIKEYENAVKEHNEQVDYIFACRLKLAMEYGELLEEIGIKDSNYCILFKLNKKLVIEELMAKKKLTVEKANETFMELSKDKTGIIHNEYYDKKDDKFVFEGKNNFTVVRKRVHSYERKVVAYSSGHRFIINEIIVDF